MSANRIQRNLPKAGAIDTKYELSAVHQRNALFLGSLQKIKFGLSKPAFSIPCYGSLLLLQAAGMKT
jgi:hypothetical protein